MMGRKRLHSDSIQPTTKWGNSGNYAATPHYYYYILRGSCIGIIDVVMGSKGWKYGGGKRGKTEV